MGLNSTLGITGWQGNTQLKIENNGVLMNVTPGIHQVAFVIDRTIRKGGALNIQLKDAAKDPAQTKLVLR